MSPNRVSLATFYKTTVAKDLFFFSLSSVAQPKLLRHLQEKVDNFNSQTIIQNQGTVAQEQTDKQTSRKHIGIICLSLIGDPFLLFPCLKAQLQYNMTERQMKQKFSHKPQLRQVTCHAASHDVFW